jgi:transposase
MNDESKTPSPPDPPPRPTSAPEATPSPPLSPEERQEIVALYQQGRSIRKIAKALQRRRRTISDTLQLEGVPLRPSTTPASAQTSKLDPFRETIKAKAAERLPVTRILREIREQGYTGGRSILAHFVRSLPSATPTPVA